jgi:hypothetical protein
MGACLAGPAPFGVSDASAQSGPPGPKDGTWRELPPPVNEFHRLMFVDPVDGQLTVMQALNGLAFWKFDPSEAATWSRASIEGDPPNLGVLNLLLVDPAHERLLAVGFTGVYDSSGRYVPGPVELWQLPLRAPRAWSRLATMGAAPEGRYEPLVALDETSSTLYLVGGALEFVEPDYSLHPLGDTWSIDLDGDLRWEPFPVSGPGLPGAWHGQAIFEPTERKLVVLAPEDSVDLPDSERAVWALPVGGSRAWQPMALMPEPLRFTRFELDPFTHRIVSFESRYRFDSDPALRLWSFDAAGAGAWSEYVFPVEPLTPLFDGFRVTIAMDRSSHRLLTFGSFGTTGDVDPFFDLRRSDVWTLDLDGAPAWSRRYSSVSGTSIRWIAPPVLDSVRRRLAGVTGLGSSNSVLHTFDLDGPPAWKATYCVGAVPPSFREGSVTVFDPIGDRLVLFGGLRDRVELGDLWELSFAVAPPRWRRVIPSGEVPTPRGFAAAVHDPARHRLVLFGGFAGQPTDESWELDLRASDPTWRRIHVLGSTPPARWGHSAVYDSRRDAMVIFGGRTGDGSTYLQDTWSLSFADCDAWLRLPVEGGLPLARAHHASAYDPVGDRMIVLWGVDRFGGRFDSKALEFGAPSRWTDFLPAGPSPTFTNEPFALYDPAGDRMLVTRTREPIAGTLRALEWDRSGAQPPPLAEGPAFRLIGVGPNPSRGDVNIAFELPRTTTVQTRLYDARGRLVRDLGRTTYQPGPHLLCWDGRSSGGERLRDGVYFARIEVEGKAISGKIVLMD